MPDLAAAKAGAAWMLTASQAGASPCRADICGSAGARSAWAECQAVRGDRQARAREQTWRCSSRPLNKAGKVGTCGEPMRPWSGRVSEKQSRWQPAECHCFS